MLKIVIIVFTLFLSLASYAVELKIVANKHDTLPKDIQSYYISLDLLEFNALKAFQNEIVNKNTNSFGVAYLTFSIPEEQDIYVPLFKFSSKGTEISASKSVATSPTNQLNIFKNKILPMNNFTMTVHLQTWTETTANEGLKNFVLNSLQLIPNNTLATSLNFVASEYFDAQESQKSAFDTIKVQFNPLNLPKKHTIQLKNNNGQFSNFIQLSFSMTDSLVIRDSFTLDSFFTDNKQIIDSKSIELWQKIIKQADAQSLYIKQPYPLLSALLYYNNFFVDKLKITKKDKVLLLALSTCDWSNFHKKGELYKYHFSRVAIEDPIKILNDNLHLFSGKCKFKGGDCTQPLSCFVYDFASKSNSQEGRKKSQKFIEDDFLLIVDDKEFIITKEDYVKNFEFLANTGWHSQKYYPNHTDPSEVTIMYEGTKPSVKYKNSEFISHFGKSTISNYYTSIKAVKSENQMIVKKFILSSVAPEGYEIQTASVDQ